MLLGPVACMALLLVAAGASKIWAPAAAAAALGAGAPSAVTGGLARGLGAAEIALGGWALLAGGRPAALALLVAHAGFGVVTAILLRRPTVPCGCFGAPDAPASPVGLSTNVVATAVAAAATVAPPDGLLRAVQAAPLGAVTVAVLAVVAAWLVHEIHAAAPVLRVAR